ncbi:response regulator transcription factor [Arsenicibacter rosenii]|uniref:HTH luxR-type domain-containing protein n=1 Tax=Arsenicibacter rosenii TaxID=1750698 RepID=A0A1S2VL72_9BACT|nr:helix-turn-helix transcriptional regulator [Arsenicibacter rosenii]OIN59489.1 hypothetical protein BLX24_11015 [Arsenicibacter rosenii]
MCRRTLQIRNLPLTEREAETLLYCAKGLTITETADKLFISPKTVQRHRENLREKFNLTEQGYHALVLLALEVKEELEKFLKKEIRG